MGRDAMTDDMVARAQALAIAAHEGQSDKSGAPYWKHPARVAGIVRELYPDASDSAVAVAWLHDVIEDTGVTASILLAVNFPPEVVDAVLALTRPQVADGASRELKANVSAVYYANIRAVGGAALMVKHADITDNLDAERLALLEPALVAKLQVKYAHALEVLGLHRHN